MLATRKTACKRLFLRCLRGVSRYARLLALWRLSNSQKGNYRPDSGKRASGDSARSFFSEAHKKRGLRAGIPFPTGSEASTPLNHLERCGDGSGAQCYPDHTQPSSSASSAFRSSISLSGLSSSLSGGAVSPVHESDLIAQMEALFVDGFNQGVDRL